MNVADATRHSYASNLIAGDVSPLVVSKLMGHSNMRMTERYAHVNDKLLRSAADVIKLPTVARPWLDKKEKL